MIFSRGVKSDATDVLGMTLGHGIKEVAGGLWKLVDSESIRMNIGQPSRFHHYMY